MEAVVATAVEAVVATEVEAVAAPAVVVAEEAEAEATVGVATVGVAEAMAAGVPAGWATSFLCCGMRSAASPRTSPCGTRRITSARAAVVRGIALSLAVEL